MSFVARLRRDARLAGMLALASAVIFVPALAAAAWLTFVIHPVLAILSGLFAAASTVFAVVQARECRRLFRLLDAEETRPIPYPVFPARRLAPRADITSPLPRAAAGRTQP